MNDDAHFMELARQQVEKSIAAGQTPFGAVIVKDGQVVAAEHNHVWATTDPTAHAEVNCIRAAAKKLGTIDLAGCVIYSTTEPCPMCFSAIHWAKLDRVVFGARIADAEAAGFAELRVSNEKMKDLGGSPVEIVAEFQREPCAAQFQHWLDAGNAKVY